MFAVAIDGPAGAGKSTIARRASAALGFIYVDTGAMYRTVALYMLRTGVDLKDATAVEAELGNFSVDICYQEDGQHVLLNGEDVSSAIRTPEVSLGASAVSAHPVVRNFLFGLQLSLAEKNNVVMDGRDIGTVVLPNAQAKIFLTASPEERARRRFLELQEKGLPDTYEEVLADVKKRDLQDSTRAVAPLKPAEDAVILDTTGYTLEESIDKLIAIVKERLGV
ncbi:MAG: (d)CMP kinase [Clostridia bacterium]|nr:(d)CMP kinase [Clostridia bacterium]